MPSVPETAGITLVCCGLLGTLVADEGLIERSFAEAIATQGVVSGTSAFARRMSQVHRSRGLAPGDLLRELFPENEARAQAAQLAFDHALRDALSRAEIAAVPGIPEALARIRDSGRQVCVLTALSRRFLDRVLDASGLADQVDLAVSRDEAPRGFPAPDLILTAVLQSGTAAVAQVAMVHDTGAGMESGRRAGAGTVVGVLTGPHAAARLRGGGAGHVIASFAGLPALLRKLDPGPVPAQAPPGDAGGRTAAADAVGAPVAGLPQ